MKNTSFPADSRPDAILSAALTCFTEHGVSATTIDMIRRASGASVGSLYHHFGSKDAIAGALYLRGMEDHFSHLQRSIERCSGPESAIKTIVRTYCQWISDNPDWARFIFSSRGENLTTKQKTKLKSDNRRHMEYLRQYFAAALEKGEIKRFPNALTHSLLIGPAQDYARQWLFGRVREPLSQHCEIFCDAAWLLFRK